MKNSGFRLSVLLFWLFTTGWLIRYEAFPQWFTHSFPGYHALFEGRPFIVDSWMQITFRDVPIGYSHTWVDSDIESHVESHTIRNRTVLALNLLGESQTITVLANAGLDERYRMETFSTLLHSQAYSTQIEGRRIGDDQFKVRVSTHAGLQTFTLSVPDDVMLYSPATELAVRRLKPGESIRFRVLDPISMTVSEIVAHALRREKLRHEGRDIDSTVLKLTYMGLDMLSWVDRDGRVLRHETPFGWVMTARSSDEVLPVASGLHESDEMLSAMAVPCVGEVVDPRSSRKLSVRLHGIPFDPGKLASHRQAVERRGEFLHMTVRAQAPPRRVKMLGEPPPDAYRRYLEPSPYLQSEHPDIMRRANAIAGGHTNSFEAAKAISGWLQDNIQMLPTFSLPSALDVLQQRVGDCNEITYLFTALARAAGIPARVHVGIVYAVVDGRGAFYYHAWPSVYVGEWVEMDPTWGQATVDATHISLVTGELGDQLNLLAIMGRAKVEILSGEGAR